jgi:hypothetical protein
MTKKKSTRTAAAEQARRNAWAAGADAFAVDIDAPGSAAQPQQLPTKAQPLRICNASMPRDDDYRTGYGEVHQPVRAGAMAAYGVKSAGLAT